MLPTVSGLDNRRVMLQSQPLSAAPAPPAYPAMALLLPAPAPPLANFEAQHSRVGCTSLPDVKSFCDRQLYGATVEPAKLPPMARAGTRLQRLRSSKPVDERRPMGVPTDDPATQLQKNAGTRTKKDLVGVAIEREALRRTPLERTSHVVRPGFKERGAAQEERLRKLRQDDERLRLAFRHERQEETRRRLRQVREHHALATRRQPVEAMREEALRQRQDYAMQFAHQREVAEAAEAGGMLGAFEARVARTRVISEAGESDDDADD